MIFSHINIIPFAKLTADKIITIESETKTKDLSSLKRIEELISLRTLDTKTYLKENGMLETDVYGEIIHYLEDGIYKEIDNTLELIDNLYVNKANSYLFSYDYNNILGSPKETVERNKINLKDEITYQLNNNEKLQYILNQNSIKENIILNSYIENYQYSIKNQMILILILK